MGSLSLETIMHCYISTFIFYPTYSPSSLDPLFFGVEVIQTIGQLCSSVAIYTRSSYSHSHVLSQAHVYHTCHYSNYYSSLWVIPIWLSWIQSYCWQSPILITHTPEYIACMVNKLLQVLHDPKTDHWNAKRHILRYPSSTVTHGIV